MVGGNRFDFNKIQEFIEDPKFPKELRKDPAVRIRIAQLADRIRKDSEMPEVRGFPASQREFLASQLVALFWPPEEMN